MVCPRIDGISKSQTMGCVLLTPTSDSGTAHSQHNCAARAVCLCVGMKFSNEKATKIKVQFGVTSQSFGGAVPS